MVTLDHISIWKLTTLRHSWAISTACKIEQDDSDVPHARSSQIMIIVQQCPGTWKVTCAQCWKRWLRQDVRDTADACLSLLMCFCAGTLAESTWRRGEFQPGSMGEGCDYKVTTKWSDDMLLEEGLTDMFDQFMHRFKRNFFRPIVVSHVHERHDSVLNLKLLVLSSVPFSLEDS